MALTVEVNPFTGDLQLLNDGAALNFEAPVANAAALPPTGNEVNDARITNDDGHIWIWDGAMWVDQGNFIDVEWDSIIGKPTSTPAEIDAAVAAVDEKADKVDPFANHTLLLMHFDGADDSTTFTDEIGHTIHSVVGTPHIDTAESQFGGSSLRIDNGNTIRIDDSPDWDFGTSDFTIECWAKFESHTGEYRVILARGVYYDQPSINWGYQPTNDRIDFQINTDTGSHIYGFLGSAPTDGVWYHLAVVRTGGTIDMYRNGIQLGKTVSGGEIGTSSVNNTNKQLEIGGVADFPAQNFVGWLEEFRISDTARYTASFTPPTAPFDLECDLNIALLQGADGNLEDSGICHERLENALADAHMQGTDQTLDLGGENEVSAEEIRDAVDAIANKIDKVPEELLVPYAQWKLNDDAANTIVLDTGDGGNNGVASTDTEDLTVAGKINSAFNFANLYRVAITNFGEAVKNDATGAFSFWLKTTSNAAQTLIAFTASSEDTAFQLGMSADGTIGLYNSYLNATRRSIIGSTNTVNDGDWHYIVFTQDGTGYKIYIDGVLETLASSSTAGAGTLNDWLDDVNTGDTLDAYYFGGGYSSEFLDGSMDDVRYYSGTGLTLDDITEIYNSGNGTESFGCAFRIPVLNTAGELEDSGICQDEITDALAQAHNQNTDQYLDQGGANESSAADVRDVIDNATRAYRNSFVDADLSSGILTVTHNLGEKYVTVQVYDNNDKLIVPDEVTLTNTTTLTIDLTSFGTLTGTWNYIVVG